MNPKRLLAGLFGAVCLAVLAAIASVWAYAGPYGLHVLLRHGGTYWLSVGIGSSRLSPSMRLALREAPVATPGEFGWHTVRDGFEVADLPALVGDSAVDHVLLARIDPARFLFVVRNASDGDKGLDQWMTQLGAAMVVNGSYYALDGKPDTPFLSDGIQLGPRRYDAKAGAFVASPDFSGVRDLSHTGWQTVFQGAKDAMVS